MSTTAAGRPRETQAARSARTRGALLRAARELFATKGFAATGRDEIAERAGVTRGALYHHFASKTDVAAAVVEQLEGELVQRVVAAALEGTGVRDQLHRGCRAYMDACADPTMARILADAPAVLGMEACRALDAVSCAPLLAEVFARAAEEHVAVPGDPEVAAALLLGFLNEAAGLIAAAPEDRDLRGRVGDTVDEFISRLFA
ncbi:MAG TPA: helix-turn-helix domain-containing protein [Acidimicrobiales bacterium]|nr:helix-turn-helix domain-containing protein [Acidimicrobiales bacterium]